MTRIAGGRALFASLSIVVSVAACGGSPSGPSSSSTGGSGTNSATFAFRASPVDMSAVRWITPLGNLNPPAHSIPTDHIYFYIADPDAGESPITRRTEFRAPADGTVVEVFDGPGGDRKLYIRATSTVNYYIDHLIPDSGIGRGSVLTAGQRVGTTGAAYGVDLGVVNSAITVPGLLNLARYGSDTINADSPLKYFDEPIRSELYAKVQRLGSERDGRIGYDVAGRLAGNWFAEVGTSSVSFAYNTYDPTQVRIAISGRIWSPAVFAIGASDPIPATVAVANGLVTYALSPARTGLPLPQQQTATMLVQMVADARIQVEMFPVGTAATAFTSNAVFYVR
jgi:hypothetical protein